MLIVLMSPATTTDTSWSRRSGGQMSTLPSRSSSVTRRGGSRAVAPSRRRAGGRSSSAAASSTSRSDYRLHLVVTASVGGCMLVLNVTLFFCFYCHRRVRHTHTRIVYSLVVVVVQEGWLPPTKRASAAKIN